MKKIFILLVSLFGFMACEQKKTPVDSEEFGNHISTANDDIKAVKDLIKNSFEDIWSDLDSTKIGKYHTDDFLLLENGIVWNNDSVKNYLSRERKEMEIQKYKRLNRFEFIKSVDNQNTVWIAYDNYGTWIKGADTLGTLHWLESVIAIKEQDEWKLQQLHSTTVRE
jgi:hypothetical protein